MNYTEKDYEDLETLFSEIGIKISSFEDNRPKPYQTNFGPYSLQTLLNKLYKEAATLQRQGPNNVWWAFANKNMKAVSAIMDGYVETRLLRKVAEENEESKKYEGHILAVDGSNGSDKEPEFFLIDSDGKKSGMLAAKYIALMAIESPIAVAKEITPIYLPRDPLGMIKVRDPQDDEKTIDALNTYIPPTWIKYLDDDSIPDELPEEIELIFKSIFIDEMDLKYVWHWIYLSITSRTSQFMVLCGDPGNGKNRIKIMIRALHGQRNSEDGKEKMFSTQFNTKLKNNTFIFCDEASYEKKDVARMKEIPNGSVSIEGKHKDATRATRIFCNVVLANNYKTDNWLDFIDRKFFAATMAEQRLDDVVGAKVVDIITRKMEDVNHPDYDEKYIAQFGKWVLKNGCQSKLFPRDEFKGSLFYELAHSSMSDWQRNIITILNMIATGGAAVIKEIPQANVYKGELKTGELKMSEIKACILKSKTMKYPGSKFPRLQMCLEFLKKYRNEAGEKIFEMKRVGDSVIGDFYICNTKMGGKIKEIEVENEVADL